MVFAEISKVLIGVFMADLAFHSALLLFREEPKLLGIKFTKKLNSTAVITNIILITLLAWSAWLA